MYRALKVVNLVEKALVKTTLQKRVQKVMQQSLVMLTVAAQYYSVTAFWQTNTLVSNN